jgi:TonB family protein
VQVFATKKRFYRFQVFGATSEDPRVKPFFASIALGKGKGTQVSDGQGTAYGPGAHSTTPISTERIYTGKEVDRKAVLVVRIEPQYTEVARANKRTGTVVLKVVFSPAGNVTNMRTVSGLPHGLTERAIAAARGIKFIPAMKDGKFVAMWMQLEYNFNLY